MVDSRLQNIVTGRVMAAGPLRRQGGGELRATRSASGPSATANGQAVRFPDCWPTMLQVDIGDGYTRSVTTQTPWEKFSSMDRVFLALPGAVVNGQVLEPKTLHGHCIEGRLLRGTEIGFPREAVKPHLDPHNTWLASPAHLRPGTPAYIALDVMGILDLLPPPPFNPTARLDGLFGSFRDT